jgi:hypothetical protein
MDMGAAPTGRYDPQSLKSSDKQFFYRGATLIRFLNNLHVDEDANIVTLRCSPIQSHHHFLPEARKPIGFDPKAAGANPKRV